MAEERFDLITVGRVSMDLFSQNIGAPFDEIESFTTSVGGTPTNVAIGASRLGLKTALLTAVADDDVGRFVRRYLQSEGVETRFIPVKAGTRTGLALLGIEPPDTYPLTFYRQDPADIHLTIDDVRAAPIDRCGALLLSGTAASRGTCRDATFYAAEKAKGTGVATCLDLDLRADQWSHPLAYGISMRLLLPLVDVVIGTEEEFWAALGPDPQNIMRGERATTSQSDGLAGLIGDLMQEPGSPQAFVLKRGAKGVTVFTRAEGVVDVPGFSVKVLNTVGAGDAFAGGLIYGRLSGWDWARSGRFANACGSLVVTRHGCAEAMPTRHEVDEFIAIHGGS